MPKGVYDRGNHIDVAQLENLYYERKMTQEECAKALNVTTKVIEKFMVRNNMPRRKAVIRPHIVGKLHPHWRGDNVRYKVFHKRLYRLLGNPKKCSVCGTEQAKLYDWANLSGKYEDPKDYKRMCRSCHFKYDGMQKNFK